MRQWPGQSKRPRVCPLPVSYTSVLAKSAGSALWSRENQILRHIMSLGTIARS